MTDRIEAAMEGARDRLAESLAFDRDHTRMVDGHESAGVRHVGAPDVACENCGLWVRAFPTEQDRRDAALLSDAINLRELLEAGERMSKCDCCHCGAWSGKRPWDTSIAKLTGSND